MIILVFLFQITFFVLLFCIKIIFQTRSNVGIERVFYIQSSTEIILGVLLFLGLSFVMCKYILKTDNMIHASLWTGLSLFFLFELSKYIEHMLGFLPNYGDVPIIISMFLSLAATLVYMCVLYVICLLLKRI